MELDTAKQSTMSDDVELTLTELVNSLKEIKMDENKNSSENGSHQSGEDFDFMDSSLNFDEKLATLMRRKGWYFP